MKLIKSLKMLPAILTVGLITEASASSIFLSASNVQVNLGNIETGSYDGGGHDNIKAFTGGLIDTFEEYSTFDGGTTGTNYDIFFLSSVADYKNFNTFGFLNEQDQFVTSISGSSALGTKVSYSQSANEKLKFGFQSPEGMMFSKATDNKDGRSHILSLTAAVDSVLTIPKADKMGNSISFNLLAGDIICFIEDEFKDTIYNGGPGDFDYNDFLTVIRAKPVEVPEPATVCLLGLGALGALRRRKAN